MKSGLHFTHPSTSKSRVVTFQGLNNLLCLTTTVCDIWFQILFPCNFSPFQSLSLISPDLHYLLCDQQALFGIMVASGAIQFPPIPFPVIRPVVLPSLSGLAHPHPTHHHLHSLYLLTCAVPFSEHSVVTYHCTLPPFELWGNHFYSYFRNKPVNDQQITMASNLFVNCC